MYLMIPRPERLSQLIVKYMYVHCKNENAWKLMSEKLREKFPSTTLGYSMDRTSCLNDALLKILKLATSPVEVITTAAER